MKKLFDYNEFHTVTLSQTKVIKSNNFTYKTIVRVIDNFIGLSKNILDIGSGAGTLCLYYASKGYQVMGIDISGKAIRSATKSAEYLQLENVKFRKMNYPNRIPNKKFDFIIFSEVIEHLNNDDTAMKTIGKLLKKEGIVLISTPSKNAPLYRWGLTKNFDRKVGHLRRYSIKELEVLCVKNGLDVIYIKKTEGILRNFLFINPIASKFIRFIKYFISDIIAFIDNATIPFLGESNIIMVARKR